MTPGSARPGSAKRPRADGRKPKPAPKRDPSPVPVTPRAVALQVLTRQRAGAFSEHVLHEALRRAAFSPRDAALATRLCYGVLQNRMLLDEILAPVVVKSLQRLESAVLDILRLGVYQLLFMDKIPAYAVVSESVALARTSGHPTATGFVNAVLRRLGAHPTLPPLKGEPAEALSLRYSQPAWQVEEYLNRLGPTECEALLQKNNDIPPVFIHTNRLKTDTKSLHAALTAEGLDARAHPTLPDCLMLSHPGDITRLDAFQKGHFLIADAGAALSVLASGVQPGARVLDACAAPGGKSALLGLHMGNQGEIFAFDKYPHKIPLIDALASRLGLTLIQTDLKDAAVFDPELADSFDLVVADAPCSGLGVVRKKPEIRYKRPEDLERLPALQMAILDNVARYVRPGGRLLYITCTLRRAENEDVADAFLRAHPAFTSLPFSLPLPTASGETQGTPDGAESPTLTECPTGHLTLWPQRHNTDGFFFALFGRKDSIYG